jgi:RNA polymerase sigma-70 factor (ECF subfamily)
VAAAFPEAACPLERKVWSQSPMVKPSPSAPPRPSRARKETCRTRDSRNPRQPFGMLYLRPPGFSGNALQFHAFDAAYIENLRAGDHRTQEHFVGYFTELLHMKLRSRLQSPQAIEDVRQETFARVFAGLRKPGAIRQPESLGAFVNTVCNNVLFEHYRASSRSQSLDDDGAQEIASTGADAHTIAVAGQIKIKVQEILLGLPVRDRSILKAVFLDERDRDEICREFAVDREYLRVLLHRAKQDFKAEYLKKIGGETY